VFALQNDKKSLNFNAEQLGSHLGKQLLLFSKAVFSLVKFRAIMPATATGYVLALATLGDATQIESLLFYAMPPKVAKATTLSALSVTLSS
jgi:hypothetical protein